jgi:hypothetical protein
VHNPSNKLPLKHFFIELFLQTIAELKICHRRLVYFTRKHLLDGSLSLLSWLGLSAIYIVLVAKMGLNISSR